LQGITLNTSSCKIIGDYDSFQKAEHRRTILSWALYDFANSSFTTLIVTFIYATYFTKAIADNETVGTAQWANAITITGLIVAVLSPYMGAMADRGGYRRRFLMAITVVGVVCSAALFFPQRGEVLLALTIFTLANVAFELGSVFYNAYLPDIATKEKIGRVSGFAWGMGYIGGLLSLVVALVAFVQEDSGVFAFAQDIFGFSTENGENIRATNLLVAVWYAIFALPIFLWVKDRKPVVTFDIKNIFRDTNRQLRNTFYEIRSRHKQTFRFLIARLVYNDGLVTVFAFGGIYAQGTFGFTTEEVILFGIVLNVMAGLGAFAFGYIDDKIGGKRTIVVALICLFLFGLVAVLAPTAKWFWVSGIAVGIMIGPTQSASRSLMGRFVPFEKETEFYGFFAFSGKATAFLGPMMLGLFTTLFDSQRVGVSTVLFFFIVGLFLLLRVDEKEGMKRANRPPTLPAG